MAKENKTRYALLGVLSAGPASGYDIKKFCDRSIAHFWHENYGHIYPVLRELEVEGLICGDKQESPGKPPRTVYRITAAGQSALRAWLEAPADPSPTRNELLLKLIFSADLPPEAMLRTLETERKLRLAHLKEYHALEALYESSQELSGSTASPYWLAALRYGMLDAQFRMQWCEETTQRLRNAEHAQTTTSNN